MARDGRQRALYPEPVHNTGRAGFGVGDDGDEPYEGLDDGNGMAEVAGAGAAGLGAAGVLGRYGSQSTGGHQPSLPAVPPSVYTTDHSTQYGNYYDGSSPEGASAYTGYSQTPSQHSHAPLTLGPAAVGYASQDRHSPSPPRTGSASYDGHAASYEGAGGSQSGHLPFPGEAVPDVPERMLSPRPMQVGDTFGQGYDETDQGKRWRLTSSMTTRATATRCCWFRYASCPVLSSPGSWERRADAGCASVPAAPRRLLRRAVPLCPPSLTTL